MAPIIDRKLIDKMYTTTLFTDLLLQGGAFTANVPITFPLDEIIITQIAYASDTATESNKIYMVACDFPIGTQYISSFTQGTCLNLDTRINMMRQTINQQLAFRVYQNSASANIPQVITTLRGQLAITMTFIKYVHTV
jgi:hypothetical protein